MSRRKDDAERRDLMRVGLRVPLHKVETPVQAEDFCRCPLCYQEKCDGCKRERSSRYSAADYAPYAMSEDDLIAYLDLLHTL